MAANGEVTQARATRPCRAGQERADTCRVAVMEAMGWLGRALGFDIVADGIETAEQQESARMLGAPDVQGFLLSRPMTVDAMATDLGEGFAESRPTAGLTGR